MSKKSLEKNAKRKKKQERWLLSIVSRDKTTAELHTIDECETDNLNNLYDMMFKATDEGHSFLVIPLEEIKPTKKKR